MRGLTQSKLFAVLLCALSLALGIIHFNWIFSLSPLVSNDWPYFYTDLLRDWSPFHPLWIAYDGLGRGITQGNFVFLFSLYGALAKLNLNFEVISRLLFFIPVLIAAPVTSYYAAKRITGHKLGAISAALVYSLNTYFIVIQGGHMHLSVTYALAPLAYLLATKKSLKSYLWLLVTICIIGLFDIRMALVIFVFAAIIGLYYEKPYTLNKLFLYGLKLGALIVGFILFNSFWVLPLLLTSSGPFTHNYFQQDALNWVSQLDAFSIHHPFWSSYGVTDFVFQKPEFHALILPILAFMPLAISKARKRKDILFFSALALLSMIPLMQENSLLGNFYGMIYENVPLMSMFRESTKIFFVTAFCYSILIAFLVSEVQKNKQIPQYILKYGLVALVLALCLPLRTYLLGNYVKSYEGETISSEIKEINNIVSAETEQESHRNLWVSRVPKFALTTNSKPNLSALTLADIWNAYNDPHETLDMLNQPNIVSLLNFSGIKYVIVPSDTIDNHYHHYGEDRDAAYYKSVVEGWGLKKIYEKNGSTIWINDSYKPKLYISEDVNITETVGGYSGITEETAEAYLFEDQYDNVQNKVPLNSLANNEELQVFNAENLSLSKGKIFSSAQPDISKNYTFVKKSPGDNSYSSSPYTGERLELQAPEVSGDNLYADGSFENKEEYKVIDANNFDSTSLAHNGIYSEVVGDGTEGDQSIEIRAKKHIADLSQKIENFNPDSHYLLTFDYKYFSGPAPLSGLYPYSTEPDKHLSPLDTSNPGEWNTYSTFFEPGRFTEEAFLLFYVPTRDGVESRVRFDNVKFYELPSKPQAYLRTSNPSQKPASMSVKSDDGTIKHASINGLQEPQLFVMSETYDPNWKLTIVNTSSDKSHTLAENTHLIANMYANSWWIDPETLPEDIKNEDGNYAIQLEYEPQRWFFVGSAVSTVLTLLVLAYIAQTHISKRSKQNTST